MKNLAVLNLVLNNTKNKKWIIVMGKEIKKTSLALLLTKQLLYYRMIPHILILLTFSHQTLSFNIIC